MTQGTSFLHPLPASEIDDKPILFASWQNLGCLSAAAWEAVYQSNDPPRYFRHGCTPVRIEEDDNGTTIIRELTIDRLRHEVARVATWLSTRKKRDGSEDNVEAKPPIDVIKDMLATPDPFLPVLNRIVGAPVCAPDGSIAADPGYHSPGRVWYAPTEGVVIPPIPDEPTAEDVLEAVRRVNELYVDFPFVADADKAHAFALMLLPFARDLIPGPTPNHLIESHCPGSGKGLLADVALSPGAGINIGIVAEARSDEEMRKRLTSVFRAGRPAALLDNITKPQDSGILAAALTAMNWEDRVLGRSEMATFPVRCVWVTTANNPTMSTEIARRTISIRLNPKVDRPWQRDGFLHPDLRGYAAEQRGNLIWASLAMIRSWVNARRPLPPIKPLGSYEAWTKVIGGVLHNANIPGFLDNLEEFYEVADSEGEVLRAFVAAWWERFSDTQVVVSELHEVAVGIEGMDLGRTGKDSEKAQKISLGMFLNKCKGRVVGKYMIHLLPKKLKGVRQWRLITTKDEQSAKVNETITKSGTPDAIIDIEPTAEGYQMRQDEHGNWV